MEGPGSTPARVLVGAAFTAPLVFRRRAPAAVLALILAVLVVRGALSDVSEQGSMPVPALLVATFSAALYAQPPALAAVGLVAPFAGVVAADLLGDLEGEQGAVDFAILGFFCLGAWLAGWLVRRRAAQLEAARAAAPELAREAVAAERTRMARELHDVVAHSVSIINVQAGAAGEIAGDERVKEHLETIRRTAHEALVELRRLVGVLREDEPRYSPQAGLDQMDDLLEGARVAGLGVQLREEGERRPLPPGVDLAAYRIVQESLTNARRHAGPVPATVRIRYAPEMLELEVANEAGRQGGADGAGSGHGLIGMRERVRLYGGRFEAGPTPGGGFRVHARLPLEAEWP